MNNIKFDFKGFRIQVKDKKYEFPIENWEYENEEQFNRLDQLNLNFGNVRSEFQKHITSGKITSISLSEKSYQTILNIAVESMRKLRVNHIESDIKILFEDVPLISLQELGDDTIGVSSYGSI